MLFMFAAVNLTQTQQGNKTNYGVMTVAYEYSLICKLVIGKHKLSQRQ